MNTRNIYMIFAAAVFVGALNSGAAAMDPPSKTKAFEIPKIEIDAQRQKSKRLPSPGIYRSEPYLTIVIVPESVDTALISAIGHDKPIDDIAMEPFTRLEPYRPSK